MVQVSNIKLQVQIYVWIDIITTNVEGSVSFNKGSILVCQFSFPLQKRIESNLTFQYITFPWKNNSGGMLKTRKFFAQRKIISDASIIINKSTSK